MKYTLLLIVCLLSLFQHSVRSDDNDENNHKKQEPIEIKLNFSQTKLKNGDVHQYAEFPEDLIPNFVIQEDPNDLPEYHFDVNKQVKLARNNFANIQTNLPNSVVQKFVFWDQQDFSGIPISVIDVFNYVFTKLSEDVAFAKVTIPIQVKLNWVGQGSNILGSAGPVYIHLNSLDNLFYSDSQMNQIANQDIVSSREDIIVNINSDFDRWWVDFENPPIPGSYCMASTMIHEIMHGVGVIGLVGIGGSYANVPSGTRFQYDDELYAIDGTQFRNLVPDGSSSDVEGFVEGSNGPVNYEKLSQSPIDPESYTPPNQISGSSLYHLNFVIGEDDIVMTPSLSAGIRRVELDLRTRALLYSIYWDSHLCESLTYESLCVHSYQYHNSTWNPCGWNEFNTPKCNVVYSGSFQNTTEECNIEDDDDHEFPNTNIDGSNCRNIMRRGDAYLCVFNLLDLYRNGNANDLLLYPYSSSDSFTISINGEDISGPILWETIFSNQYNSVCFSDHYQYNSSRLIDSDTSTNETLELKGIVSMFHFVNDDNDEFNTQGSLDSKQIFFVDDNNPNSQIQLPFHHYEWKNSQRSNYIDGEDVEELWLWNQDVSLHMNNIAGGIEPGLAWCKDSSLIFNTITENIRSLSLCDNSGNGVLIKQINDINWRDLFSPINIINQSQFEELTNRVCHESNRTPLIDGGKVCVIHSLITNIFTTLLF